ncbi:GNAT family N-acetyltransferase [Nocardia terpenica]|uniref:GNAT family N-acetyltransferase n=1 Tax=Nocardia terpenica TaxID=455432 RepID=UPI001895184C|nr:GNAT family N-acetyltransferase [Nocardia terpenica]MBF6062849.1 GNAT family N-acetyltransferase [Nocardia terpenica]MBF6105016.1 GNAT family N-acetyltransferase [Nocardia terpenica]MBF6112547.1 GNAT family N-acetyltransferase [Nocardia terpenica]MBF6118744.1 GNAT family N-acetyltransferase [Nocardia terpenica]MBF6154213.1 GNAT family N-acetyltransferase [Nocardia terpenica]
MTAVQIDYRWRAELADTELVALTRAHGGTAEPGWWDRIRTHSLGWMTARLPGGDLIGFANVAWDGGDHAFLLDPKVHPGQQHRGIGTELVRRAADAAARSGCTWLHVDFEPHLRPFYFDACGFRPTDAGLIAL